jgi:ABC-2 type transport system ATP-binding protein
MPGHAIEARDLTKRYPTPRRWRDMAREPFGGSFTDALRGVSLDVPAGSVFGLLGANGAGKTTLLKILATLVLPTSGTARVDGHDVGTDQARVRRSIGFVVAEERSFHWRLTGRENLLFFGGLHDLWGADLRRAVDDLLAVVGLTGEASRPFREYSTGMRQRLAIARGLLGSPRVIFMDEPTRALDPPSAATLRRFVRDELVSRRGATVLLATHDLLEAETTCDRLALVDHGRVFTEGTPAELKGRLAAAHSTAITLLAPGPALAERLRAPWPGAEAAHVLDDGSVRLLVRGQGPDIADVVRRLVESGAAVAAVEPAPVSLAALFEGLPPRPATGTRP